MIFENKKRHIKNKTKKYSSIINSVGEKSLTLFFLKFQKKKAKVIKSVTIKVFKQMQKES